MELTADGLLTYFRDKLRVDTSAIEPETILFSSGLVDSFSMVELIVFIEKSCQIKVKPAEVNLDNLDTIERILSFVSRRTDGGNGSG